MNATFIRLSYLPTRKIGDPDCLLDGRMIFYFVKTQILSNIRTDICIKSENCVKSDSATTLS